jgi:hypothetical protein
VTKPPLRVRFWRRVADELWNYHCRACWHMLEAERANGIHRELCNRLEGMSSGVQILSKPPEAFVEPSDRRPTKAKRKERGL